MSEEAKRKKLLDALENASNDKTSNAGSLKDTYLKDNESFMEYMNKIKDKTSASSFPESVVKGYKDTLRKEESIKGLSRHSHYQGMGAGSGPAPGAYPIRPEGWYPVPEEIASSPESKEHIKRTGQAPIGIDPSKLTQGQELLLRNKLKEEMGPEKFNEMMGRMYRDTETEKGELFGRKWEDDPKKQKLLNAIDKYTSDPAYISPPPYEDKPGEQVPLYRNGPRDVNLQLDRPKTTTNLWQRDIFEGDNLGRRHTFKEEVQRNVPEDVLNPKRYISNVPVPEFETDPDDPTKVRPTSMRDALLQSMSKYLQNEHGYDPAGGAVMDAPVMYDFEKQQKYFPNFEAEQRRRKKEKKK